MKIALISILAVIILLVAATAVFAQDGGPAPLGRTVCPIAAGAPDTDGDGEPEVGPMGPGMMGANTEGVPQGMGPGMMGGNTEEMRQAMGEAMQSGEMQQMHDSMGQNIPEEMRGMHDAMGEAMKSGDVGQMQDTCRNLMGSGSPGNTQPAPEGQQQPQNPPASAGRGSGMMGGSTGTAAGTGGGMMGGGRNA